jgi:hypothetical protein
LSLCQQCLLEESPLPSSWKWIAGHKMTDNVNVLLILTVLRMFAGGIVGTTACTDRLFEQAIYCLLFVCAFPFCSLLAFWASTLESRLNLIGKDCWHPQATCNFCMELVWGYPLSCAKWCGRSSCIQGPEFVMHWLSYAFVVYILWYTVTSIWIFTSIWSNRTATLLEYHLNVFCVFLMTNLSNF